jgi:hypothetical protein
MSGLAQPSEGVFLYVLGLVVLATHPGRFWLGMTLAVGPILLGPLIRAVEASIPRRR